MLVIDSAIDHVHVTDYGVVNYVGGAFSVVDFKNGTWLGTGALPWVLYIRGRALSLLKSEREPDRYILCVQSKGRNFQIGTVSDELRAHVEGWIEKVNELLAGKHS